MDTPLASRLLNKKIGEWLVVEKRKKADSDNSGFWSTCYTVKNDLNELAFLKAYNYTYAFKDKGNSANVLKYMTENFTYERDLLDFCREKKMKRIVTAIDSGEYREDAELIPVPYLIFEIAQSNLKSYQAIERPDLAWKLKAFHGTLVGLRQLHNEKIAHQDIKPSNILIFGKDVAKISDLGSATKFDNPSNWSDQEAQGDLRYAPIELLYNYFSPDWNTRRVGADVFMMGGILTYMITGTNFLSMMHARLPASHRYDKFGGSYKAVEPFLMKAYYETLDELKPKIEHLIRDELLNVIAELSHPIPENRGSKKRFLVTHNRFSLDPYISIIDRLYKKLLWSVNVKQK